MPNIGIKTNLEKLEKKLKDKRKLLDKLEENYWIRKKKLEFNIRQLDEEEKKYHEKKQFLDRKSVSSTTKRFVKAFHLRLKIILLNNL